MGAFLDAFQKVADLANNSHGAIRELGGALTRLCIRHRSVETQLKTFASAIVERLHEPLQGKIEEWKRVATQLDKDHSRDYKKGQQEIKKMSVDIPKLQKRAGKGRLDARQKLDQILLSVGNKCQLLENAEVTAVRGVMLEEHARFCFFVQCLQPLMDGEMNILHELSRFQEVIDIISEQTKDPTALPPAGEQVLHDLKSATSTCTYQTPPGSPVLSSLSRKSSLCSVDSSSSGSTHYSTTTQSPNHRLTLPLHVVSSAESSCVRQLSSISSQDSGFVSHDILLSSEVSQCQDTGSQSQLKGTSEEITENEDTSEKVDISVLRQPIVSDVLAHSASGPALCSALRNSCSYERPHTISAAYSHSLSRPKVTAHTFEPPYGFVKAQATASVYATPTNIYRQSQTADIYARPTLCGRRFSQGAVAVAPPVVPSHYATCQKQRINGGGSTEVKPTVRVNKEEMMEGQMHRSCSLPSPVYNADSEHTVTECRQPSSCGTLNQLQQQQPQQRRVLVKDDNYITHTYAVLDAGKLSSSKDYELICDLINSKRASDGDLSKSSTLPRSHQFKVPDIPVRKSSVDAGRNFIWRSGTLGRSSTRVKPLPPARCNSAKTNFTLPLNVNIAPFPSEMNPSSRVVVPQAEDSSCDPGAMSNTLYQPRQQAPPTDDDSDVLFPSPPPELKCHVEDSAIPWPTDCTDSVPPFVTNTEMARPTCCVDDNFVEPNVAADPASTSDISVAETDNSVAENTNSMLALIRKGVKLRKTATNDRSAPKLD